MRARANQVLTTLVFFVFVCILSGVVRFFLDDHPIRVVPDPCGSLSRTNFQPELMQQSSRSMRLLLVAVMSITALSVVLFAGASGSQDYTTHIGLRVPPSEARCVKTGELSSDDGRLLSIFQCPV